MIARLTLAAIAAWVFLPLAVLAFNQEQAVVALDTSQQKKWDYKDCGKPHDALQLERIEITPEDPQAGQNMTVFVSGLARQEIETGAYADVTVKMGLVKFLQKRFDVCEEAKNGNISLSCPVEEGRHEVTKTVTLPNPIPSARFVVEIRGYTKSNGDMACVDLGIDFRKPRFVW